MASVDAARTAVGVIGMWFPVPSIILRSLEEEEKTGFFTLLSLQCNSDVFLNLKLHIFGSQLIVLPISALFCQGMQFRSSCSCLQCKS